MTSAVTGSQSTLATTLERGGALFGAVRATAYLVLAGLTVSPLLWAAVPPLVDYPNHLARMWILAQDGKIADLARNYLVHWQLVPNLAIDAVIPLLAQVMPIEAAGRTFIALTMLGLFAGTMALQRALFGRVGVWPLCSLLFIYNTALYWGFLNSLFGIALYLLAFAGWIASRHWPLAARLALFSIVAALILVSHLFAFGLYALTVVAYEFDARVRAPRPTRAGLLSWAIICLHLAPAMILWACSASAAGSTLTHFGGPSDKLRALMAPATFAGEKPPVLDCVLAGLAYFFLLLAVWRQSLVLATGMRLPLIAMVVTALLTPNWLGGSWLADIRLPVALPFIIIGATRLEVGRRWGSVLALVALALLALRVWTVSATWRDEDQQVTALRTAIARLPQGSRLLVVEAPLADWERAVPGLPRAFALRSEERLWHLPALSVIDRAAFIPYLFTGLTTIQPAARNAGLFVTQGVPVSPEQLAQGTTRETMGDRANATDYLGQRAYWTEWPKNFDDVLWLDLARRFPTHLDTLQPVAESGPFRLYRVVTPR